MMKPMTTRDCSEPMTFDKLADSTRELFTQCLAPSQCVYLRDAIWDMVEDVSNQEIRRIEGYAKKKGVCDKRNEAEDSENVE